MQHPTGCNDRGDRQVNPGFYYHPELDVLRFFAFLAVFLHHALPRDANLYIDAGLPPTATEWLMTAKKAGAFGLDLFFALSSYLITELLLREHAMRGSFSIGAFYVRRALRIWPLYFTFLGATVFIIPHFIPDDQFRGIYILSFALFLGNWACVTNGLPISVASPLWSISVEEQFYVTWPLCLFVFGVKRVKHIALVMIALALATRILLATLQVGHFAVWCNTFARLDPIALGAVLAWTLKGRSPQIKTGMRLILCGIALTSWFFIARHLSQHGPTSVLTYLLSAAASVMLIVAVLRSESEVLLRRPLSWLVYLGRISYGLYVFHLLALTIMSKLLFLPIIGVPLNFERRVFFAFVLTVMLATASYKWLEQPFLKLKTRFTYLRPERGEQVSAKRMPALQTKPAAVAKLGFKS